MQKANKFHSEVKKGSKAQNHPRFSRSIRGFIEVSAWNRNQP